MLQGIIQNRYVKWIPFILAILAGCVGSVLGWMLVPELRITSMVFGFLVGFAFISLFIELLTSFFNSLTESTSQQLNHLVDHVYGVEQELQSMINIRPLLKKWLHHGSIIILDDGYRDDEKIIAEKWVGELNANLEFYSSVKGSWIFHSLKPTQ